MSESIIVAVITGVLSLAGTLTGSYFSQRKSAALIAYRLEQLEKKVDKHNSVIERTYQLEKRCEVIEEKIKVANHRIEDLEDAGKVAGKR
jgi:tetrahydromethanopterin S-methyltransferase subunit G